MTRLIIAGRTAYQIMRDDRLSRQAMGDRDHLFIKKIPVQCSDFIPSEEIWFVDNNKRITHHAKSVTLINIVSMIVDIGLED